MAREDPQLKIRLPADLKAEIEAAAFAANRTMNAEIVSRLQDSLAGATELDHLRGMLQHEAEQAQALRLELAARTAPLPAQLQALMDMLEQGGVTLTPTGQNVRPRRAGQHDDLGEGIMPVGDRVRTGPGYTSDKALHEPRGDYRVMDQPTAPRPARAPRSTKTSRK